LEPFEEIFKFGVPQNSGPKYGVVIITFDYGGFLTS